MRTMICAGLVTCLTICVSSAAEAAFCGDDFWGGRSSAISQINSEHGVRFDINADGRREQISWTDPRSDVALLALDRNGNGTIDDGEELFGSATPVASSRAAHGFDALLSLEGSPYGASRPDGVIDSFDSAFKELLFWMDRNQDGLAQPGEIRRVSDTNLIALETKYRKSKRVDRHGNEFRLRGISWWRGDRGRLEARIFYDVWFAVQ